MPELCLFIWTGKGMSFAALQNTGGLERSFEQKMGEQLTFASQNLFNESVAEVEIPPGQTCPAGICDFHRIPHPGPQLSHHPAFRSWFKTKMLLQSVLGLHLGDKICVNPNLTSAGSKSLLILQALWMHPHPNLTQTSPLV